MERAPEIALIVATYNRAKPLANLLKTLCCQTLPRELWEVWVIVDGSTDSTVSMLKEWQEANCLPLRFLYQVNAGQAKARHEGVLKTQASSIVILDDDMEVCPEFMEQHLRTSRNQTGMTVTLGKIISAPGWQKKPLFSAVGEAVMAESHRLFAAGVVPNANAFATNVSFPRALYLQIGGYDSTFRLDEDRELGYRFERAGARFTFNAAAEAIHHSDVGTFQAWEERQYRYGHNACRVWRKYKRDPFAHPLRNYLNGLSLKRRVIHFCTPSDRRADWVCYALRKCGDLLQFLGFFKPAIAAYKGLAAVRYHQGVRDNFGSWREFQKEIRKYAALQHRPRETTLRGVTIAANQV